MEKLIVRTYPTLAGVNGRVFAKEKIRVVRFAQGRAYPHLFYSVDDYGWLDDMIVATGFQEADDQHLACFQYITNSLKSGSDDFMMVDGKFDYRTFIVATIEALAASKNDGINGGEFYNMLKVQSEGGPVSVGLYLALKNVLKMFSKADHISQSQVKEVTSELMTGFDAV